MKTSRRGRGLRRRYGRSVSQKWIVLLNGKIVDSFYMPVGLENVRRHVSNSNAWYMHDGGTIEVQKARAA